MSKTRIKVSVLVAAYNIEQYIGKCIESIIHQLYEDLEIILVDDCSTDLTGKICDQYAELDRRIKVIHHEKNIRLSGVRNTGLDLATGDYIIFVDGDDWLASDFVTYMLNVILETKADMAINLVHFTTRDGRQTREQEIKVWTAEKTTAELLFPHITVGAWNKIYKRDFIEKNHLRFHMELFTAEGERFIIDAAQRANWVGVGCRKVYFYRLNNVESATTKYDIRQSEGALYAMQGIEQDLVIRSPCVMAALQQQTWLNHFWNLRQILALKKKQEKNDAYKKSLQYVRKYALEVIKSEPIIGKKIKYCLTGISPCLAAQIKNKICDMKLRRDNLRHKSLKKGKKQNEQI